MSCSSCWPKSNERLLNVSYRLEEQLFLFYSLDLTKYPYKRLLLLPQNLRVYICNAIRGIWRPGSLAKCSSPRQAFAIISPHCTHTEPPSNWPKNLNFTRPSWRYALLVLLFHIEYRCYGWIINLFTCSFNRRYKRRKCGLQV